MLRLGDDFFNDEDHGSVRNAFQMVSPYARKAVQQEIVPQIEEMVTDKASADGLFAEAHQMIETGFKQKNEVYMRMIQYKGIEQSDQQFKTDLLASLTEWYEDIRKMFEDEPQEEPAPRPQVTLQDLVFGR